jgi:hypothetical protein
MFAPIKKHQRHIRVGAVLLEVAVVGNAGSRAGSRGVVRARAASGAVARVGIDKASRLAANREAAAVVRALERRRAVGAKVNWAVSDLAALVVGDTHGQVVAINEGDVVEVW